MHVTWYTAMSMDGRIADANDGLAFLDTIGSSADDEDGFEAFIAGIDAVVIGGATLRWLVAGGHGWPHGDLPTWLLSRDVQVRIATGVTEVPIHQREGDIEAVFAEIEAAGHERVWLCGGGDVAGQALAADRIDEVIVTIAPTVLGAGPSLFDAPDLPLRAFTLEAVGRYEAAGAGGDAARLRWVRKRD